MLPGDHPPQRQHRGHRIHHGPGQAATQHDKIYTVTRHHLYHNSRGAGPIKHNDGSQEITQATAEEPPAETEHDAPTRRRTHGAHNYTHDRADRDTDDRTSNESERRYPNKHPPRRTHNTQTTTPGSSNNIEPDNQHLDASQPHTTTREHSHTNKTPTQTRSNVSLRKDTSHTSTKSRTRNKARTPRRR